MSKMANTGLTWVYPARSENMNQITCRDVCWHFDSLNGRKHTWYKKVHLYFYEDKGLPSVSFREKNIIKYVMWKEKQLLEKHWLHCD